LPGKSKTHHALHLEHAAGVRQQQPWMTYYKNLPFQVKLIKRPKRFFWAWIELAAASPPGGFFAAGGLRAAGRCCGGLTRALLTSWTI